MPDTAPLIDLIGVNEYFVDSFDGYECRQGILTCAGYRVHPHTRKRLVVVRIVMPVAGVAPLRGRVAEAIERETAALARPKPILLS